MILSWVRIKVQSHAHLLAFVFFADAIMFLEKVVSDLNAHILKSYKESIPLLWWPQVPQKRYTK